VPQRLIAGISGASGSNYDLLVLMVLQGSDVQTHLGMTESARILLAVKTNMAMR
jgi:4-hydroxy-3-polyprenylbenzoate decarboxylase